MTEEQIQQIADRVIAALENLAPVDPGFQFANLGPVAVFIAAGVAAWVGWRNLLHQQTVLKETGKKADDALEQKREADARSEWWRRAQWALEAKSSEDPDMNGYGSAILDVLPKSNLTGLEDKKLLDIVWKSTPSEMQDEEITEFIAEFKDLDNLDPEEEETLRSFFERNPPASGSPAPVFTEPAVLSAAIAEGDYSVEITAEALFRA